MRVWECRHAKCGRPVFYYTIELKDGAVLDARYARDAQGAAAFANGEPVWCHTCNVGVNCWPPYVEAIEHAQAPWEPQLPLDFGEPFPLD